MPKLFPLMVMLLLLGAQPAHADNSDPHEDFWQRSSDDDAAREPDATLLNIKPSAGPMLIAPGMKLYLDHKNDESLSGLFVVNDAGALELPMVGSVKVSGLKIDQARQEVWRAYAQGYFIDPRLDLEVMTGE